MSRPQYEYCVLHFRDAAGEGHGAVACLRFDAVLGEPNERVRYRVLLDGEYAGEVAHVPYSRFGWRPTGGGHHHRNRLAAAADLVGALHVRRIVKETAAMHRVRIGQQLPAAPLARRFGHLR